MMRGAPERAEIRTSIAAINSGARPGVLTDLQVARSSAEFFTIEGGNPIPNFRDGELVLFHSLGGETKIFNLEVATTFPDEAVEGWRSGSFASFDVEIKYTISPWHTNSTDGQPQAHRPSARGRDCLIADHFRMSAGWSVPNATTRSWRTRMRRIQPGLLVQV
jgi:hypothetical protein